MLESVWNIPEGEFVSYLCVTGFIYYSRFLWAMWIHTLEFSIVVSLIWLGHVEWFHFLTLCQTILNCFYNICRCWQQFVVTELEFWFTWTGSNSSFAILHHLIHGNRQWFRDGILNLSHEVSFFGTVCSVCCDWLGDWIEDDLHLFMFHIILIYLH